MLHGERHKAQTPGMGRGHSVPWRQLHSIHTQPAPAGEVWARLAPAGAAAAYTVQWSEDVIKADPFFGRSWVRFRVPPWVSNAIARNHLA